MADAYAEAQWLLEMYRNLGCEAFHVYGNQIDYEPPPRPGGAAK